MEGKYPIAATAALLADASRAAVLIALLDGSVRSAGELALLARATPQSASMHLAKLVEARLLTCSRSGRNRYYRLAGADVARAVEALGVLAAGTRPTLARAGAAVPPLRAARSCYDHLAGVLGVRLCEVLQKRRYLRLTGEEFTVTASGERFFKRAGWWPENQTDGRRRPLTRTCLDWTERRWHLAGALGASILADLLRRKWVVRPGEPRTLRLTPAGTRGLRDLLGLEFEDVET